MNFFSDNQNIIVSGHKYFKVIGYKKDDYEPHQIALLENRIEDLKLSKYTDYVGIVSENKLFLFDGKSKKIIDDFGR